MSWSPFKLGILISLSVHGALFCGLPWQTGQRSVPDDVELAVVTIENIPLKTIANTPKTVATLADEPVAEVRHHVPPAPVPAVTTSIEPSESKLEPPPVSSEPKPAIVAAVPVESVVEKPALNSEPAGSSLSGAFVAAAGGQVLGDATSPNGAACSVSAGYLKTTKPTYPKAARRKKEQGLVLLSVKINSVGIASAVSIEQSSGFKDLDDTARSAVKEWQFSPAQSNGVAVASAVQVPIRFTLDN